MSPEGEWLKQLKMDTEPDGVRVLEHEARDNSQFFVLSTRPEDAPPEIVWSVKGRLQHLIQKCASKGFRRNFRLTSIAAADREAIEAYVSGQLGHHRMADTRVDRLLGDFHFEFLEVDLSLPQHSKTDGWLRCVADQSRLPPTRGRRRARRTAGLAA